MTAMNHNCCWAVDKKEIHKLLGFKSVCLFIHSFEEIRLEPDGQCSGLVGEWSFVTSKCNLKQ